MQFKKLKTNSKWIAFFVAMIITVIAYVFIQSISNQLEIDENRTASRELLEFLPNSLEGYGGENGYFHQIEKIEKTLDKGSQTWSLTGTVKDRSSVQSLKDDQFRIDLTVTSKEIIQTVKGDLLNETDYQEMILLQLPLKVGHKWSKSCKSELGNWAKITGEILSISEDGSKITVSYSSNNGSYEERTLQKGLGVTDYIAKVNFKSAESWTGYHSETAASERSEDSSSQELPTTEVKISTEAYELILQFNQRWETFIQADSTDETSLNQLTELVKIESPAAQKIQSVDRNVSTDYHFVRFYPYEVDVSDTVTHIYVVEILETMSGKTIYNKVLYTLYSLTDNMIIYDFEVQSNQ